MVLLLVGLAVTAATSDHDDVEAKARAAIDRAAGFDREWVPEQRAPAAITVSDDRRVERFLGALAGGVVGAAASLALLPLGDVAGSPFTAVQGFLTVLVPLLTMTGTFVGYQLMGGDGGLAATSVAVLPAGLALALLMLTVPRESTGVTAMLPHLITALVLLAAGSTVALDFRQRQLESLGSARLAGSASAARVAAEAGMNVLALGSTAAVVALMLATTGAAPTGVVLGVTAGVVGLLGASALSWGLHAALKGKGTFLAALGGLLVGLVGGVGVTLLSALFINSRPFIGAQSTLATIMAFEVPTLTAMMFSSIALELSHTAAVADQPAMRFDLGGAPVPGGAMVAAGLRF